MKRIKTTTIFILLSFILVCYSCGGDSDSSPATNENQEEIENYKLLKSVTYTDFWYGEKTLDFAYSNELLIKENDGGELVYFEYNSNNKIILEQECSEQDLEAINIDTYDCENFYTPRTYTYTNGKRDDLNYDENGNVISDISPNGSDSLYYTYSNNNGKVLSLYVSDGSGGYTITYEFDNKINPFNVLWEKYGYYDWGGQSFEPYSFVSCIIKHNANKVYKDNVLELEANYTYDSEGYPINCGFTEYLNDGSTRQGTVTFLYK